MKGETPARGHLRDGDRAAARAQVQTHRLLLDEAIDWRVTILEILARAFRALLVIRNNFLIVILVRNVVVSVRDVARAQAPLLVGVWQVHNAARPMLENCLRRPFVGRSNLDEAHVRHVVFIPNRFHRL